MSDVVERPAISKKIVADVDGSRGTYVPYGDFMDCMRYAAALEQALQSSRVEISHLRGITDHRGGRGYVAPSPAQPRRMETYGQRRLKVEQGTIDEALERARVTVMAPPEPSMDVSVKETTRGRTWEVTVKDAASPEQAIELLRETILGLAGVDEEPGAEEDQEEGEDQDEDEQEEDDDDLPF